MIFMHFLLYVQYLLRERGHPPILHLKSEFYDIYNSVKLYSNCIINTLIES